MQNNLIILDSGASASMKKQALTQNLTEDEIKQANERSKGLISVGPEGRPLLDFLLYNAKQAGYKNIYIVVGKNASMFKKLYGEKESNNNFNGLNISFPVQHIPEDREKPFGTADALFQALEQYPELQSACFTVCNSDNLYSLEALKALRETDASNAFISYNRDAMDFPSSRISSFAIAKLDDENYLMDIIEKPSPEIVEISADIDGVIRVSMNAFKFDGKAFYPYLKNCPIHPVRNEKELPKAFLNMLKDFPKTGLGIPFSEHVPDLTAKDDIGVIKKYLAEHYDNTLNWN